MARAKKKKSILQGLVGDALTAGLPTPLRELARNRLGMPMLLMVGGLLIGSGIVSLQWGNGSPTVAVNRQRAAEVKREVEERIVSTVAGRTESGNLPSVRDVLRRLTSADGSPAGQATEATSPAPGPSNATASTPPGVPASSSFDTPVRAPAPPVSPYQPTIYIATFNIQVFGVSKLQKPHVMQVLAETVRRFDIVAIQEVRSVDDSVMPQFVAQINSTGGRYDFIIGPRLGRTNSKEQYAFVFDTARIEVDPRSIYTIPDPRDLLHREPLVARFRARGAPSNQAFTFTLVNIHTDPDETSTELDALAQVFTAVQQNGTGEDDVILLGDLNVDERRLGNLGRLPGIGWVVSGVPTNTRGTKTYDNIVFDRRTTVEFTGRWGIVNLMQDFQLTVDQALEVSDHLPVWAEFSVYEGLAGPLAAQPGSPPR